MDHELVDEPENTPPPSSKVFRSLIEVLLDEDLLLAKSLLGVLPPAESKIAGDALLSVFSRHDKKGTKLALQLLRNEITNTMKHQNKVGTLFRDNSLATSLMSSVGKIMGVYYLKNTIMFSIVDISARTEMENPFEIRSDIVSPEIRAKNCANLSEIIKNILDRLFCADDIFPEPIRDICNILYDTTRVAFPESKYFAVGGFVFLRFICPAIISPEAFNLIPGNVSFTQAARQTLITVSRVLQLMANQREFDAKQKDMMFFNQVIQQYSPHVKKWLDKILAGTPSPIPYDPPFISNERYEKSCNLLYAKILQNKDNIIKSLEGGMAVTYISVPGTSHGGEAELSNSRGISASVGGGIGGNASEGIWFNLGEGMISAINKMPEVEPTIEKQKKTVLNSSSTNSPVMDPPPTIPSASPPPPSSSLPPIPSASQSPQSPQFPPQSLSPPPSSPLPPIPSTSISPPPPSSPLPAIPSASPPPSSPLPAIPSASPPPSSPLPPIPSVSTSSSSLPPSQSSQSPPQSPTQSPQLSYLPPSPSQPSSSSSSLPPQSAIPQLSLSPQHLSVSLSVSAPPPSTSTQMTIPSISTTPSPQKSSTQQDSPNTFESVPIPITASTPLVVEFLAHITEFPLHSGQTPRNSELLEKAQAPKSEDTKKEIPKGREVSGSVSVGGGGGGGGSGNSSTSGTKNKRATKHPLNNSAEVVLSGMPERKSNTKKESLAPEPKTVKHEQRVSSKATKRAGCFAPPPPTVTAERTEKLTPVLKKSRSFGEDVGNQPIQNANYTLAPSQTSTNDDKQNSVGKARTHKRVATATPPEGSSWKNSSSERKTNLSEELPNEEIEDSTSDSQKKNPGRKPHAKKDDSSSETLSANTPPSEKRQKSPERQRIAKQEPSTIGGTTTTSSPPVATKLSIQIPASSSALPPQLTPTSSPTIWSSRISKVTPSANSSPTGIPGARPLIGTYGNSTRSNESSVSPRPNRTLLHATENSSIGSSGSGRNSTNINSLSAPENEETSTTSSSTSPIEIRKSGTGSVHAAAKFLNSLVSLNSDKNASNEGNLEKSDNLEWESASDNSKLQRHKSDKSSSRFTKKKSENELKSSTSVGNSPRLWRDGNDEMGNSPRTEGNLPLSSSSDSHIVGIQSGVKPEKEWLKRQYDELKASNSPVKWILFIPQNGVYRSKTSVPEATLVFLREQFAQETTNKVYCLLKYDFPGSNTFPIFLIIVDPVKKFQRSRDVPEGFLQEILQVIDVKRDVQIFLNEGNEITEEKLKSEMKGK